MFADVHGPAALGLLAGTTLLHETGVPIPVLPVALFVGARFVEGPGDFYVFTFAMVFATWAGNLFWYGAGHNHGRQVLRLLTRLSLMTEEKLARAQRSFGRWGPVSLVLGHFLPGVTVVAPPLAGALGMKAVRFTLLTLAGGAIYATVLLGAGVLMRDQVEAMLRSMERVHGHALPWLAAVLGTVILWRGARRVMASRNAQA